MRKWSALGLLWLLLVSLLERYHDGTHLGKEPGQEDHSWRRANKTFIGQSHPTEEQHRSAEQTNWGRQNRINLIIIVLTVIAVEFSYNTFVQTRRQADIAKEAYLASKRAWMDVSVVDDSVEFRWDLNDVPTIGAELTGINQGNSPALEASVSPALVVGLDFFDPKSIVRDKCGSTTFSLWGSIVFMKQIIVDHLSARESMENVRRYQDERIRLYHESPTLVPTATFYLVACAQYRISGDTEIHHTARIFQILHHDGGHVSGAFMRGERMSRGEVILKEINLGAYAD
jgi:hypothetical protein